LYAGGSTKGTRYDTTLVIPVDYYRESIGILLVGSTGSWYDVLENDHHTKYVAKNHHGAGKCRCGAGLQPLHSPLSLSFFLSFSLLIFFLLLGKMLYFI